MKTLKTLQKIQKICRSCDNPESQAKTELERTLINLYMKNEIDLSKDYIIVNFRKLEELGLKKFLSDIKKIKNIKIIEKINYNSHIVYSK